MFVKRSNPLLEPINTKQTNILYEKPKQFTPGLYGTETKHIYIVVGEDNWTVFDLHIDGLK